MYEYVHVCMDACINAYRYACMFGSMHVCMPMGMQYVCLWACMYVCLHACMQGQHVCMYAYMHVCKHLAGGPAANPSPTEEAGATGEGLAAYMHVWQQECIHVWM